MRRLLQIGLIWVTVVVLPGTVFGWGGGQGSNQGGQEKRHCSSKQEKGLLVLLKQLDQPVPDAIRGGVSEVRWKYQIIKKLRKYDDCRAEDALERLSKENLCEEQAPGEVICLKFAADAAVEEITFATDLQKLVDTTPLKDQLKIIRKYTKRPYINDFALNKIAKYLTKQAVKKPEFFVPLLIELFPRRPKSEKIARSYPLLADKGLEKIFDSKVYEEVWWGINMARYLGRSQFAARINAIAFAEKGNLDYSLSQKIEEIQRASLSYFQAFKVQSASYLPGAKAVVKGLKGFCLSAEKGCKTTMMIDRYIQDLADNSSGFAVVGSIGYSSGDGRKEADKSKIKAILIGEHASWDNDNGKPTVIITGAIHGNEWAGPEVSIGIAEYLLLNRNNDKPARDDFGVIINEQIAESVDPVPGSAAIIPRIASVKELLQSIRIIIIPVFNRDGYNYSHTPAGKQSYYGTGWRPNRRTTGLLAADLICYKQDGAIFSTPSATTERCFLADYDDRGAGGELEEEEVIVCENPQSQKIHLFKDDLDISSAEMFDAVYSSTEPSHVICASNNRRVWREAWDELETISLVFAKADGYLQEPFGVDLNRNYEYKWDMVQNQKSLFIRSRSPSSRMYRGRSRLSEGATAAIENLIEKNNVVALIDYHSGSTQVLYPYAYSTTKRADRGIFARKWGKDDKEVFRKVSEQIAGLLNRHDRGDESIVNYSAAQNYNGVSVGSGVARDGYYQVEGIAAINIEVHNNRYTYEHEEFSKVVPKICKTNVPGAIWFLFWAAELK